MAVYLVGPDDKTIFRRRSTWDLMPALEAANDGDIIEIQEGFCFTPDSGDDVITIEKNLTIQGKTLNTENGLVLPTIEAGIFVKNEVEVTLKNLCLRRTLDKRNCLNVQNQATVNGKNLVIENTATDGENYPIVYVAKQSNLSFDNVRVEESAIKDGDHKVYIENSNFKVNNSEINARVYVHHSQINCNNTMVTYFDSNALFLRENSFANIKSSEFIGGKVTKKTSYSCVMCRNSEITLDNTVIYQPNYSSALHGIDSTVKVSEGKIDSANFLGCEVTSDKGVFAESLFLQKETQFKSNTFSILGKKNGKINLFADDKSSVISETINFGLLTSPNIKLDRNVEFQVKRLHQLEYDQGQESFVLGEDGNPIIVSSDLEIEYFGEKSSFEKLNDMVGLNNVKSDVKEFIALAQMNKAREKKGLGTSVLTLHSLFLGNPGTGKTTVARIIGNLLYEKGIISKNYFAEVSRSDLVGQYIGHTAIKTREVLESALGGVLFIDEAYTLANGGEKDFGLEAINEILKFMEDNRADIVIIFAGYTDNMNKFLEMNEGLKSRIPNVFDFQDYTPDELVIIGLAELHEKEYQVNEEDYSALVQHNFELSNDFSNGRWVRNLNERIIRKLALRLFENENADMSVITQEDLLAVKL
ncbi:AAA family ATPase [Vagococcus elongatus]|uniref:AAA+ ATPase domain-containing protein n=1 Tax=Vagococcus elongatus TaxID=180344 RepID=A0A430B5Z2_9ENTE|nr:AAA family ATPase [Vagococcus elongatus]RSU15730.1 hypothetical protein CBF29_01265 [Vagococcus elongatus]